MLLQNLSLILTLPLLALSARPKNAILLSGVRSLTLRGNGAKTTSRRVDPIPQLKCVSSKAVCDLFPIDVMRCTNQGSSYGSEDIEWSCTASLPEEFKLGSTEVICEGYSSPDDPYVLKGSCGVEYRLLLTDKGEQRYPDVANSGRWFSNGEGNPDWGGWLFAFIFLTVLGWILYSAWRNGTNGRNRVPGGGGNGRGWGGGGGGGGWGPGWGPGNDPPPPYPGTKPDQGQQGWRPGFWTGLAGGAAAAYLAGNRNNRREERYPSQGWGAGPSSRSFSSDSGSSSASNASRYESTGFGSTRRR